VPVRMSATLVRGVRRRLASLPSVSRDHLELPMAPVNDAQTAPEEPVVEETLVEEVSIDGMCGVY